MPQPDPLTGLFLWQNIIGVWPADGRSAVSVPELRERLHAYAEKAVRESGARTSWNDPDVDFESAVHRWIDEVIDGPVGDSVSEFVGRIARHGWSDSLGQKLLQLLGPGVPDVYQGTELWRTRWSIRTTGGLSTTERGDHCSIPAPRRSTQQEPQSCTSFARH